jgi:hypothetical protein
MLELNNILNSNTLNLTIKILLAALALVFFIFTVIIVSRVKILNHSVQIYANKASSLLFTFAILYSVAVFFLFIIILVIV